jgi:hypothetical protein
MTDENKGFSPTAKAYFTARQAFYVADADYRAAREGFPNCNQAIYHQALKVYQETWQVFQLAIINYDQELLGK